MPAPDHPAAPWQSTTWWVLPLLLLVGVGEVLFLWSLPFAAQVAHVPDDSFFYLRVAHGFAATGVLTFDGSNPTYGYQPLWQLLLLPLAHWLPTPAGLFAGVQVLCALLHVAIGAALWQLARRLFGGWAGVLAAALWTCNPGTMVWCWGQKENGLYALVLLGALSQCDRVLRAQPARLAHGVGLGLWLGLIVLTRINALLVVLGLWALLPLARGCAGGLAARVRVMLVALPVAVVVAAPWYLFAWYYFGSAMPSSGIVKQALCEAHVTVAWGVPWLSLAHAQRALQHFPAYLDVLLERGFGAARPLLTAGLALVPVALLVPALRQRWRGLSRWSWPLAAAALLAAGASFADQMLLPLYIAYADWYSVAFQVAVPLLGTAVLLPWLTGRRALAVLAAVALVAAIARPPSVGAAVRLSTAPASQPPGVVQPLEVARWAARSTPVSARFALWDPGIVSYFSERSCTSLDPLIGAIDYVRPEVIGDPLGYLRAQRIDYLFGVADRDGERWRYVPLPPGSFDIVWLPYPDHDVGWIGSNGPAQMHYVLVRPHQATGEPFVQPEQLPFGIWYPNDPQRRRWLTGDRDRLLAGCPAPTAALRLQFAIASTAAPLQLLVDDQVAATFAPGTVGWRYLDPRPWRGRQLRVAAADGAAAGGLPQAHCIDD